MTAGSPVVLRATGISGGYERLDVVHQIDLTVRAGEAVCLLGPNGAGKTTVMRALMGSLRRRRGTVEIDGRDVSRRPTSERVRAGLVHVTQERRGVLATLSVAENLRLADRREPVAGGGLGLAEVLEIYPVLAQRWRQRAGTLSGGEQQMLALAQGFLLRPRCLLLDEPSAGLAPIVVRRLFAQIAQIAGRGPAMVLAEQRVDLALAVADRGYLIEAGRCTASGTAESLRDDTHLTRAYLGADAPTDATDR
jgi:branched-chain amino acid transport system ATP-binding protein